MALSSPAGPPPHIKASILEIWGSLLVPVIVCEACSFHLEMALRCRNANGKEKDIDVCHKAIKKLLRHSIFLLTV